MFLSFLCIVCCNVVEDVMEGYLSKKSIHINESFLHAIALALW